MTPKVYCIVVTYNGIPWIEKCLKSVASDESVSHIIVVDNGSVDNTAEYIRDRFPQVRLLQTEINIGFGQANNIALEIAINDHADYVFLLNQDAWVARDAVSELVRIALRNPSYGIISPLHLKGDGLGLDKFFREHLINSDIGRLLENIVLDRRTDQEIVDTDFVNAAAWLISGTCLTQTGGFDPIFFHYGEDDNYAQRVRSRNFLIGISLTTKIFHDRDDRISTGRPPTRERKLAKIWIIFLNRACDIRHAHPVRIIIKRLIREVGCTFTSVLHLNTESLHMHLWLIFRIIRNARKIMKSRQISGSRSQIPHLQTYRVKSSEPKKSSVN